MAKSPLQEAVDILNLAVGLEPSVLNFIKTLMSNAQGKTAEDFFAESDSIWDSITAKAKKELGQ